MMFGRDLDKTSQHCLCLKTADKLIIVLAEKKPVVECSFHTEFDDHIFVAMDAELVLFLHDLVTSYVKEKDKGTI